MLSNIHTHTTFCDGKNTAEEMVRKAIEKEFISLGFSGHAYTPFELISCMKDTEGYIREINRLKKVYSDRLQIYLGTEEDAFAPVDRSRYEYIIGSMHFIRHKGDILPLDLGWDYMKRCIDAFSGDVEALSVSYYQAFSDYLLARRPDVVGHFDLLTKYDELGERFFLGNHHHDKIAERFISSVAKEGLLFEVNTGAIARGLRTTPYPSENLLRVLKVTEGNVMLSSDCHNADFLDCAFEETKLYLYDLGFRKLTALYKGKFTKYSIKG